MPWRRSRASDVPLPKRPYRDSALLNGALALVVVVVAWATGGDVLRALIVGAAFFVVATAWSWWRFHRRIAEETESVGGRRP
jgi:membrane protein implicated in regulation of membrane protease activity